MADKVKVAPLTEADFEDQLKFGLSIFARNAAATFRDSYGRKMSIEDVNRIVSEFKNDLYTVNRLHDYDQTS